jgi:hypothetical protein
MRDPSRMTACFSEVQIFLSFTLVPLRWVMDDEDDAASWGTMESRRWHDSVGLRWS